MVVVHWLRENANSYPVEGGGGGAVVTQTSLEIP